MEIVCRMRSNCQKEPWFGKSSSFACLMGYFPGSCSGAIKSRVPRCIWFGSCRSNSSCLTNQRPWFRSNHQRCSIKTGVLKNFAKFMGKHLCQSLFFNKVVGLRHRCFPMNSAKFWRALFLQNTSRRLLLLIPQSQWVYIALDCFLWSYVKFCSVSDIFGMFITY